MKRLFQVIVLAALCYDLSAQSHSILMDDGMSGTTGSVIEQDANGLIGIGTSSPIGNLDVKANGTEVTAVVLAEQALAQENPTDYFAAYQDGGSLLGGYIPPLVRFNVNNNGQVGIGAQNEASILGISLDLGIQTHGWASSIEDPNFVFAAFDDNANMLGFMVNQGTSSHSSGAFSIYPNSQLDNTVGLLVGDQSNSLAGPILGAMGSGIVTIGAAHPAAQLDVMKNLSSSLSISYLFHVGSSYSGTTPNTLFAIHEDGYVGVGVLNDGAALTEIGDAQNFGTTDNIPQLMVDNGAYGTGTYAPYFIVRNKTAGVGIDPYTNSSTFAIQGADATVMDILSAASSGRDGKIQFRNSAGALRHYISDDFTTNNLVIHTGSGGSANSTLTVEGKEEVTTGVDLTGTDPGSGSWYNQLRFSNNSGAVQQVICNAGNDLIMNLNPLGNGSGMLKIAGNVQIGDVTTPCASGSCYSLYVEKGILAERFKCALKTDGTNWSDYVFDRSYKLMDIDSFEKFLAKNKHLPDIPSAKEVGQNGIDLAEMDAKLLAKIEELSLYIIGLQKEIDKLKNHK